MNELVSWRLHYKFLLFLQFAERYLAEKKAVQEELQRVRKVTFEKVFAERTLDIFHIRGVEIVRFTSKFIKIRFHLTTRNTFWYYCTLRYLERYKKWMIKREPVPCLPCFKIVTNGEIFIEDNFTELYRVVLKVRNHLIKILWPQSKKYREQSHDIPVRKLKAVT